MKQNVSTWLQFKRQSWFVGAVMYTVQEDEVFSEKIVSADMFGTNFVTTYDFEFAHSAELIKLLSELEITNLRIPGGSVAERIFTKAQFLTGNWEATEHTNFSGQLREMTPFSEYFEVAASIGASVQLVVPTRVAFTQSAGQALASGTYGQRREITDEYFERVSNYIDHALGEADRHGVNVTRLEIGNEFWGSGEMNVDEYAHLAVEVTKFLDSHYPELEVITQVVHSANKYSPLLAKEVYLESTGDGDFIVHHAGDFTGEPHSEWIAATMPGSGRALDQVSVIASAFQNDQEALQGLDGILDHVYFEDGFEGIDGEMDFPLSTVYKEFLKFSGLGEIDYYITEWSARNPLDTKNYKNLGNANGLHYAHTTVEAFFELASSGIDGLNFWPLTFGIPTIDNRTLVDTSEQDLTYGGIAFSWLSSATLGLAPVVDFEVSGDLDVHGFSGFNELALFIGERSGQGSERWISLDLQDFLTFEQYFVHVSRLNSGDGSFSNIHSNPVVTELGGFMGSGEVVEFEMHSWDLVKVEIQRVTESDDTITGSSGNDTIESRAGDDWIAGKMGDDLLAGGLGNDHLSGGDGNDRLYGDAGDDVIYGDAGDDIVFYGSGKDYIDGGTGFDTLSFEYASSGVSVWLNPGKYEVGDVVGDFANVETIKGSAFNDHFLGGFDVGQGSNGAINAGSGDDSVFALFGVSFVAGGGGDDLVMVFGGDVEIHGGEGDDYLWSSASSSILIGGEGNDNIVASVGDDRIEGSQGDDLLHGGGGADTFIFEAGFGRDRIADFDPELDTLEFIGYSPEVSEVTAAENSFTIKFISGDSIEFANLAYSEVDQFFL